MPPPACVCRCERTSPKAPPWPHAPHSQMGLPLPPSCTRCWVDLSCCGLVAEQEQDLCGQCRAAPKWARRGSQEGISRDPQRGPPLTSRRVLTPTGPGHQERSLGPLAVLIFPFIQQPFCRQQPKTLEIWRVEHPQRCPQSAVQRPPTDLYSKTRPGPTPVTGLYSGTSREIESLTFKKIDGRQNRPRLTETA